MSIRRLHCLVAATVFVLSTSVYFLTMAPTASLWDCVEFITCLAKMEVGHPPGAPIYLLLGRFFTLFATSPAQIAFWANLLSVIASGVSVMLLYLITVHMLKNLFPVYKKTAVSYLNIAIPSAIGALAFAFTDTFWFSAVESEVYALSLFFTALCFWCICRWDECYQQAGSATRWLILICYFMGLSVGVHLLNLLTIPVITLVIANRLWPGDRKKMRLALLGGAVLLMVILFGFIQNGLWLAEKLELLVVNGFKAPFHAGLLLFTLLLFGGLFAGVFWTLKKNKALLHFILVGCLVFFIGYSSYALIIIRSNANPPINLNDPSQVFSLDSFLNREQYGNRPLIYGPYYNAQNKGLTYKNGFRKGTGGYEKYQKGDEYIYDEAGCGWFPRMYSSQQHHVYGYQQWGGIDPHRKERPTFLENLQFFTSYQVGHMYLRYFMWNFAGRQNDFQGYGGLLHGNWLTGIPPLDALRLGNRQYLHTAEAANKARNTYFMLPLLLGLFGIYFMAGNGKQSRHYLGEILLLLFMTGPAIVLYLNQTPFEPRERDYAFVGSFFAFAIFIGIGVFAFGHLLKTKARLTMGFVYAGIIGSLCAPVLLLSQNYDDHNRSGRTLALDIARSYLESCEPNAILFTYGDNDTYPLWYAQEVEGIRTDIRVINYGLMGADWCAAQLAEKVNEADPLPLSIPLQRYKAGDLDNAVLLERSKEPAELSSVMDFIGSDQPASKLPLKNGQQIDFSPVTNFYLETPDSNRVAWHCPKQVLYKNDILLLDMLANNHWERPVYFTAGTDPACFLGLNKYLRNDGLVYRLMPYASADSSEYFFEADALYDRFMNKIDFGDASKCYYDQYCRRTFEVSKYRSIVNLLTGALVRQGEKEKARKVIYKALRELPLEKGNYSKDDIEFVRLIFQAGEQDLGLKNLKYLAVRHVSNLSYFSSQSPDWTDLLFFDLKEEFLAGKLLQRLARENDLREITHLLEDTYRSLGFDDEEVVIN